MDGFFKHDGSRYGHVGEVKCNHCGAGINCIDHDNIVTELITYSGDGEKLVIDYYKLYRLEQEVWKTIKEKTGYDIFEKHTKDEWVTLQTVINEICMEKHIDLGEYKAGFLKSNDRITALPSVVNRWSALLNSLSIELV